MGREPAATISPFALPSDTDLRFGLLVSGVLATALLLDHVAYSALHGPAYAQAVAACPPGLAGQSCLADENRLTASVMLIGLVCLAVVGACLYLWVLPRWWVRGKSVKPYAATDPSLAAMIANYCERLRISRTPRLFTRSSRVPSAVAFSHHGHPALVLNLGLLLQARLDPTVFRAVVLHELAHLRNGDVDRTFVALAAVLALLAAAGVPYALAVGLSFLGPPTADRDAGYIFGILWRATVMTAVVLLVLAGVLRARELFADARALAWDGPESALGRVVARLRPTPTRRPSWLALHPSPADRRAALDDPQRLLSVAKTDAFAAGVIAAAGGPELALLLGLVLSGSSAANWRDVMAGGVCGALLAAFVGLAVSRAALPGVLHEQPTRNAHQLALALGSGMLVGQTVSLTGALDVAGGIPLHPAQLAFSVVYAAVLLMSLWVLLRWMESGVNGWLRVALGRSSARLPLSVCLGTWAVVFGFWYGLLLTVHEAGTTLLFADISANGSVRLEIWLGAVVLVLGFVLVALLVAVIGRGFLRLAARAVRPIPGGGGGWLRPNEPVLFTGSS